MIPRRHRTLIVPARYRPSKFTFKCKDCLPEVIKKEALVYMDHPSAVAAARIHREIWREKDAENSGDAKS